MRKTDCLFPQTLLLYGRYLFKISLIFLLLAAWIPSSLLGQSYTFNKATFCKGVQSNYPYGPVDETTSFDLGDTPHAWMEITNVYGTVRCKFEWYRPDGSYYGGYTTNAVQGNGSWVRFYSIQNFYNVTGNWTCKFYVSHNNGGFQLKAERTCSYGGCICTAHYDPVCGADGQTYSNACQANCAGVNWTQGECRTQPTCDLLSRITFNTDLCSQCLSEIAVYEYNGQSYLVYDGRNAGCTDALSTVVRCDGANFCKEGGIASFSCGNFFEVATKVETVLTDDCNEPCICTREYIPVCGSDGQTYGNKCEAECAGVTWTEGACCICPEIYSPVCGSDGITYSNSCKAQCAGVSWTTGECTTTSCDLLARISLNPDLCSQCLNEVAVYRYNGQNYLVQDGRNAGCADALTTVTRCDGSEFCKQGGIAGFNTCGNFFDVATKVETVLTDDCNTNCICPAVVIPVCGSDGNTYNNSCEAACAGVTWTDGACGSPTTCVCTNSHADYICDDFQSYDIWQKLGPQSSCWTTWTGVQGGHEDGIVQQNPNTRNKYLKIKGNNSSGGGHQDVVLKLGNKTSGKYSLKFKIWLFNGDLGYYNIMHRFTPSTSTSDKEWASNCYFDGHGSGRLIVKSTAYYFPYKMGEWIDVEHKIDLNNDITELHIDGKYVHRWRFSSQASRSAWGTKQLAAIDFYPVNNTHEFYIDKVELKKISNFNTAESRSKEEESVATAIADELHKEAVLKVAPNPFTSTLSIEIPTSMTDAELAIIDQYGRVVKNQSITGKDVTSTLRLEVADLAVGVYYVRLASKDQVLTEKVVKSK